ncbi:GvpL/GvpF family gas vesicle protein [Pseudanabaena sp. PCC 6802]|uniref:GvpL/GvpF family gas vesicle protein n=1 Tax=Pseudanabaena sp. PCC 6802 TaxID=118173 RepID=UPI00034BBAC0|nr:GvpL/GvpF family gas vesicle protein [Pseudanabaena sp. PCC 6802]
MTTATTKTRVTFADYLTYFDEIVMPLYTFAFFTEPVPPVNPPGINGNVRYLHVDNLVAAIEPDLDVQGLKEVAEEVLLKAVLSHDRVICELFQDRTLLPLRFGTAFVSEVALRDYLHSHNRELSDRLQKLQNYAEYPIKAKFLSRSSQQDSEQTDTKPELKGKEYLLAKRDFYIQQQETRSLQQQEYTDLVNLLNSISLEMKHPAAPRISEQQNRDELRAFMLLKSDQVDLLQTAINEWLRDRVSWQVAIAAPLPPYHFADL